MSIGQPLFSYKTHMSFLRFSILKLTLKKKNTVFLTEKIKIHIEFGTIKKIVFLSFKVHYFL